MGQINTIPKGYLDLIGTTTGGRNPPVALDQVTPIIDMSSLYLSDKLSTETFAYVPNARPDVEFLEVPNDEMWILLSLGYSQTVVAATDAVKIEVILRRLVGSGANPPQVTIWSPPEFDATGRAAPQRIEVAQLLPTPLPLQGGSQIGCVVQDQNTFRFATFSFTLFRLTA